MIQFDLFWTFWTFCSNLIQFDPIWSSLNKFEQVWTSIIYFEHFVPCLVFASLLGECSKYVHFDMPIRGLPILALNRIGCHSYFGFFVSFSKARAHTCVELLLLSGSTYKCTFWIEQIKWAGAHRTHYSRGVVKSIFFLSRMQFDIW